MKHLLWLLPLCACVLGSLYTIRDTLESNGFYDTFRANINKSIRVMNIHNRTLERAVDLYYSASFDHGKTWSDFVPADGKSHDISTGTMSNIDNMSVRLLLFNNSTHDIMIYPGSWKGKSKEQK